jgi:hypothetical protein
MPATSIDPLALAVLRQTPAVLHLLLSGLPQDALLQPSREGWSIKDIVAHLHDTEGIAFTVRIRRMLDEEEPFIEAIDPPMPLASEGNARRSLDDLLTDLTAQRSVHVAWIESLTPAELLRTGRHDTAGTISPANLVHEWAYHDLDHLRQIMEVLQARLTPGMGNTRQFYPQAAALFEQAMQ